MILNYGPDEIKGAGIETELIPWPANRSGMHRLLPVYEEQKRCVR
jgi:hypothetical protein